MRVFSDAVDRGHIAFRRRVGDPLAVRRPDRFVFATTRVCYLAHLAAQIHGEDVRVVVGVGIEFVIREEGDLVTPWTETQRVIVSQAGRQFSRPGLIDIRDPNVRVEIIGK